jgi:N6-L-threonylcarbamoyladenine synthase
MPKDLVLGIDTSNYTSSAALARADRSIAADTRKQLSVGSGERGLRQSEAFFRHVDNIPALAGDLLRGYRGRIGAVAVSDRPRPVEGSYMPVFRAGLRFAEVLADALGTPLFCFSHQEGHVRAALGAEGMDLGKRFLVWHISGGTSELLIAGEGGSGLSAVGGSRDISFGQLIDRVGVALGMGFPAGAELDALALSQDGAEDPDARPARGAELARIHTDGFFFNLSGMETQCLRLIADGTRNAALPRVLFDNIADCLLRISADAARALGIDKILFTGGVSASASLRKRILAAKSGPAHIFGEAALSGDNAVGTALLGVEKLWP